MARNTYTEQTWENLPSEETPITAERLGHMEAGIKTAMDNRALKEIYGDNSIRLSLGSKEQTPPGKISFEMGVLCKATEDISAAIGYSAEATKRGAISMGENTYAYDYNAFVTGYYTKSSRSFQFVCGKHNVDNPNAMFIIGNGFGESERVNIHTVDYLGNAYYKGDVANDQFSLNALGEKLGSVVVENVTEKSVISINGQTLEITVPLSLITREYGVYAASGEFIGVVQASGIPPMLFNMQISAIRMGDVNGFAVLTNTIPSTVERYGHKFIGDVELLFPGYSDPKAKVVFYLRRDMTTVSATIYRKPGSAIDFTISEVLGEKLTYDETMAVLNEEGGET